MNQEFQEEMEENKVSNKNIIYLEVCYGNVDSICIRATKKLSKADAQYYTINDALRLDFEVKQVTQVIKRTTAPVTHSVNQSSGKGRKQIIIKRPSRS